MLSHFWGIMFGWAYSNYIKAFAKHDPRNSFLCVAYADLVGAAICIICFLTKIMKQKSPKPKIDKKEQYTSILDSEKSQK